MGEIRNPQAISGNHQRKRPHCRSKSKWEVENKRLDWFGSVDYPIRGAELG
jgi:hypothetical protein